MFQSGVTILPDSGKMDQALQGLAQTNMNILQQDYQEKSQKIDEFQKIVDKSFYPVYGKDREGYLDLQNKLLEETAKIYKNSGAKLSPRDYMKVNENVKGLESYVSNYVEAKKSMYDAVQGVVKGDPKKINKEESFKALEKIAEMPLDERLKAVQSGTWLSVKTTPAPSDFFTKMAENFYEPVDAQVGDYDSKTRKYKTIQGTKALNEDAWAEKLEADWNANSQRYLDDKWYQSKDDFMAQGMSISKNVGGKSALVGATRPVGGSGPGSRKYGRLTYERKYDSDNRTELPIKDAEKKWNLPTSITNVDVSGDIFYEKGGKLNKYSVEGNGDEKTPDGLVGSGTITSIVPKDGKYYAKVTVPRETVTGTSFGMNFAGFQPGTTDYEMYIPWEKYQYALENKYDISELRNSMQKVGKEYEKSLLESGKATKFNGKTVPKFN